MQKLNYADEDIYVYLVRGKEAPKSILQASESSEPDRRTSKRSRRTNNGNLVNLKVSASTSIYQLKMMIWESLGVCNVEFVEFNYNIFLKKLCLCCVLPFSELIMYLNIAESCTCIPLSRTLSCHVSDYFSWTDNLISTYEPLFSDNFLA